MTDEEYQHVQQRLHTADKLHLQIVALQVQLERLDDYIVSLFDDSVQSNCNISSSIASALGCNFKVEVDVTDQMKFQLATAAQWIVMNELYLCTQEWMHL